MFWLLLLGTVAQPPPSPAISAPAQSWAWIEAPALSRSIKTVERSPLSPLLPLLMSPAAKQALLLQPNATLAGDLWGSFQGRLVVWSGQAQAPLVDWARQWATRWTPASEPIKRPGVTLYPYGTGPQVVVFGGSGLAGWATSLEAAAGVMDVASPSRGDSALYRELQREAPQADARFAVDAKRFYGSLARSSKASLYAGIIERAGLLELQALAGSITAASPKRWLTHVKMLFSRHPAVLSSMLGEAHPRVEVKRWPSGLRGVLRVSLRPAKVTLQLRKLFNFTSPLRYGILDSQLDAMERATNTQLERDLLGEAPKVWTVMSTDAGMAVELDVKDPAGLRVFLDRFVQGLPQAGRGAAVSRHKQGELELVVVKGNPALALGYTPSRVWLGSSTEAIQIAHGASSALGAGAPALVSFHRRDAPFASDLPLPGKRAGLRWEKILGTTRGAVERDGAGFQLRAETLLP